MISIHTVRDGDRIAVWNQRGQMQSVDGPQRLFLFRKTIEKLEQYSAAANEYLAIEFMDGRREHLRGPVSIWFDPVQHKMIEMKRAIPLDSHEAIIVYRNHNDQVERRVEYGPALFVPTQDEWLHEFRWHGADSHAPEHKIPRALRFKKLRIIPDQMYYFVDDVRTADDALLTVKLMLFFELTDIEKMLEQTHDPVADFINAVTADVVEFVGEQTFDLFKQNTEQLNNLATYQNLIERAKRIGYQINKVVYRGYTAGKTIQTMHDHAIEMRTQLKLEAENEEQAQQLEDLKLHRQTARSEERQQMETQETGHRVQLKQLEHQETLRRLEAEQQAEANTSRQANEIDREHQHAVNEEQGKFLTKMREMEVDLTRYLVAQYQNPDQLIKISGEHHPQLHLHEKS